MENQYDKRRKNTAKLCNWIPVYCLEYRWANTAQWVTESKKTEEPVCVHRLL